MFGLSNACHIFSDGSLSKHIEPLEDALVWEVQLAVAVSAVLLDSLLLRAFLGDVALLVAIVAKPVAASALKEGTLDWAPALWGQWHLIFGCCCHRCVGNMGINYLLQCLHLHHPSLYSIHLHVHHEQCS